MPKVTKAQKAITGRIELTAWSRRRVIAMGQRPWGGCLDGMNDDGLVASCTLGGIARRGPAERGIIEIVPIRSNGSARRRRVRGAAVLPRKRRVARRR